MHTFKVDLPTTGHTTDPETVLERATSRDTLTHPARVQPPGTGGETTDVVPLSQHDAQLPDYITPLPTHLDPDVLELLRRRGALTLPSQVMVHELLRGFVCYVYPMLPLLDLGDFLHAVDGASGNTVSLVLFQAVMFAGVASTNLAHLQREGFQSHKEARKILFDRVKLLYELDVESNPTTLIQVLLLMTYWYGRPDDPKGRSYWLRNALSLATDMGLDRQHRDPNHPKRQRMRRRLWYCCLVRDKLLSITERRQSFGGGADGAPPVGDIFDGPALVEALDQFYMPDREVDATSMGLLWAQKIKLCLIIARILDLHYELSGLRRFDSTGETFMVLMPKAKTSPSESAARDQELREWHAETSSLRDARFGQDHRRNGRVLGVHSATLELLYCTALGAVHRPQLVHPDRPLFEGSAAGALQDFSRRTLRSAARRISEVGRHVEEGGLIRLLPSEEAVGALIAAAVQHLGDARSTDAELRGTGRLYLGQTLHAFTALRKMSHSVDRAYDLIDRVTGDRLRYRPFEGEGEDRANSGGVAQTTTEGTTPLPHDAQNGPPRWRPKDTRPGVPDTSLGPRGNEENHRRGPNIELFSEVLLSVPFHAGDMDWPSINWSYVEAAS
jgi:hypothetical protein